MNSYEGLFIFPPESTPEARKIQFKNLDDLLSKFGAEVLQKADWGKKPLGYLIRKFHEGYFLVIDYKMDPSKASDFRKSIDLLDDLLKFMIIVKSAKSQKIAAQKAEAALKAAKAAAQPQPAV